MITKEDFKTHMRDYVIDAISDNDDEILNEAIARATAEATSYLSRFDVETILLAQGVGRKPYAALIGWIKDMAKWHFINLANVLNNCDVAEANYKNAIAELGKIQSGKTTPIGWPLPVAGEDEQAPFTVASRPKRGNYF